MNKILKEHAVSLILVTLLLVGTRFFLFSNNDKANTQIRLGKLASPEAIPSFLNPDNLFQRNLFKDLYFLYFPGSNVPSDSQIQAIVRVQTFPNSSNSGLSSTQAITQKPGAIKLAGMFISFVFVYCIVVLVTYYGAQTIGTLKFIREKQNIHKTSNNDRTFGKRIVLIAKWLGKFCASAVLFSPSYVIAYSFRTDFNTDSIAFVILMALLSNGLLITYSHRFYTFLSTESRKGYVETAIVKGVHAEYDFSSPGGIKLSTIFAIRKHFTGHVFNHIFTNARHQYMSTVKEQGSMIITGLIIIEMALNVHGHLNYELLRQLLYKNYDVVALIVVGIFYTVKLTEITVDILRHRESIRYENIR